MWLIASVFNNRDNGTFPSSQKVLLGSTALEYFHAALTQISSFLLENVDTLI